MLLPPSFDRISARREKVLFSPPSMVMSWKVKVTSSSFMMVFWLRGVFCN